MLKEALNHLDKILSTYSEGEYYDKVVEAKKRYIELTGLTNEEDDDYEARMRCFNDWFILRYPLANGMPAIEDYLQNNKVSEECQEVLRGFRYSIFEFTGKNLSGKLVIKDLILNEKLIFTQNSSAIPVFKSDFFIGRVLRYQDDFLLMNGICLLPKEGKSMIKKQIKKIKKLDDTNIEECFLLEVEKLKTKWKRFGHVDPSKIFTFEEL
jgi:hypothetical protein